MIKNNKQDKLSKLLKSVGTVSSKTDKEWSIIEDKLFNKIDKERSKKRFSWLNYFSTDTSSLMLKPILATATAVIIIVFSYHMLASSHIQNNDFKIIDYNGNVSYNKHKINDLTKFISVQKSDVYKTDSNSSLCLQLGNSTGIYLSDNSTLIIKNATNKKISLELINGNLSAIVKKRNKNQTFEIFTKNSKCIVLGTIFSLSANDTNTTLHVYKGSVSIQHKILKEINGVAQYGQSISIIRNTITKPLAIKQSDKVIHEISVLKQIINIASNKDSNYGIADITSRPQNADIIIDGTNVGRTPLVFTCSNGKHKIILRKTDYKKQISYFIINNKKITHFTKILPPLKTVINNKKSNFHNNKLSKQKNNALLENHPDYIEALIQIVIGEYGKSLKILDSLKQLNNLSVSERKEILQKIYICYNGMGDFDKIVKKLNEKYLNTQNPTEKSNLLWQIANIQINCLANYVDANNTLEKYLKKYPNGSWTKQAQKELDFISQIIE